MSASDHLHTLQFTPLAHQVRAFGFDMTRGTHGSVWNEGQTEVLSASKADTMTNFSESRSDRAYFQAHHHAEPRQAEHTAWSWATQHRGLREEGPLPRPVVHEVVPKRGSVVDQDPYTVEWDYPQQGSLTSDKGLDITDTHWIPPVPYMHAQEGVVGHQGTLPMVNWNRYGPADQEQRNWKVLGTRNR